MQNTWDEAIERKNREISQQDCPMCPPDDQYKIGYGFFGDICYIEGVAVCDTCYRVHGLTQEQ